MNTDLAAQEAMDRFARDGFDALTETEKTLASAWLFAAGVANSGFSGYYSSHRGDLAFHAPVALRAIGATRLAAIAAEANELYGPGGPSQDRDIRQRQLQAMPDSNRAAFTALDQRYFACEEDIDELLEIFLGRNYGCTLKRNQGD